VVEVTAVVDPPVVVALVNVDIDFLFFLCAPAAVLLLVATLTIRSDLSRSDELDSEDEDTAAERGLGGELN
jgi:hypothetical protein